MRKRNLPFGYCYNQGQVIVNKKELEILKQIFDYYLQGISLLKISHYLNNRNVEYMKDVVGWNKSRIKKIIDDTRYLGNNQYPQIIDEETYNNLQNLKSNKNTQKDINRNSDIFKLGVPVICKECNSIMHRYSDSRYTIKTKWICENKYCKKAIDISDEELIQKVTNILNMIIDNTNLIEIVKENKELKNKQQGLTNIIIDSFDKKETQKKLLKDISKKYKEINTLPYISKRIKDKFEKTTKSTVFQVDLCYHTVKSIHINNKEIGITLVNNQYIEMR